MRKKKLLKAANEARLKACVRCGYSPEAHVLVNYADGPNIGRPAIICPTVEYKSLADVIAGEVDRKLAEKKR